MDYNKINKIDIDGNGNIVLQDTNGSNITVNYNDTEEFNKLISSANKKLLSEIQKNIAEQERQHETIIKAIQNELKIRKQKSKIKTTLLTISIIVILFISYFAINSYLNPFSFIVSIKSSKNLTKNILEIKDDRQNIQITKGYIFINLNGNTRKEKINNEGKVFFSELPSKYKNRKVVFNLISDYFQLTKNKIFQINANKTITLTVEQKGLDRIFGSVRDTICFLDSVSVSIDKLETFTDKNGKFELIIPQNEQKIIQNVTFYKKGYKIKEKTIKPIVQEPQEILLNPIK